MWQIPYPPIRLAPGILMALTLLFAATAQAQLTGEEMATEPPPEDAEFDDYEHLVPDTPEGAVDWDLLGETRERHEVEDGTSYMRPVFPEEVSQLDGEEIRIKGFIYPLAQGDVQKEFLFTALPPSCPYCLPAGPSRMMEVRSPDGIDFTWDAVLLEGRLELLEDDPYGQFFRLHEAVEVSD